MVTLWGVDDVAASDAIADVAAIHKEAGVGLVLVAFPYFEAQEFAIHIAIPLLLGDWSLEHHLQKLAFFFFEASQAVVDSVMANALRVAPGCDSSEVEVWEVPRGGRALDFQCFFLFFYVFFSCFYHRCLSSKLFFTIDVWVLSYDSDGIFSWIPSIQLKENMSFEWWMVWSFVTYLIKIGTG